MQSNRTSRIRKKLKSRSDRPRLNVFVSNQHIYAQIIDDSKGVTLVSAKDTDVKKTGKSVEIAKEIGILIAKGAIEKGTKQVVFDRGGKRYHGRVKALAEAAREGGLEF